MCPILITQCVSCLVLTCGLNDTLNPILSAISIFLKVSSSLSCRISFPLVDLFVPKYTWISVFIYHYSPNFKSYFLHLDVEMFDHWWRSLSSTLIPKYPSFLLLALRRYLSYFLIYPGGCF